MSRRALAEIEEIGRGSAPLTSPSSELSLQLRSAGSSLWESSLGECALVYGPGQLVEVEVRTANPLAKHLAAVPWECMLEPQRAKPLAYHPDFTVFRSAGTVGEDVIDDEAPAGLRVLILAMNPSADATPFSGVPGPWAAELGAGLEISALRAGLAHLASSGLVRFEFLGPGSPVTLTAVREALERLRPHVLHYIGHSLLDPLDEITTRFLFGGDGGTWQAVSERAFLSLLVGLESPPRLLVLNSCQSAGPLLSAGLPAKLQRLGLRAVVAMRSTIFDSMAMLFADHLYRSLAGGSSLGSGCREGRRALMLAEPRWGHWILPVLYTHDPSARVLRIETSGATARLSSPLRVTYRPGRRPPFKGLEPYNEEDREWFPGRQEDVKGTLSLLREHRRLILWGEAGVGKTSLLLAGLFPALRESGFRPLYVSRWNSLVCEFAEGGSHEPIALILDQIEAALGTGDPEEVLAPLLTDGPALLLVAVRDTSLAPFRDLLAQFGAEPFAELELKSVTLVGARGLVSEIRQRYDIELEPGFVEACLTDLVSRDNDAEPIFLPFFSLVLTRLQGMLLPADRPVLTRSHYEQVGRLRGLLASHLRQVLDCFGEEATASRQLALLADETTQRPIVRPGQELTHDLPTGRAVLEELVAARLVEPLPGGHYTLTHELLASEVLARRRGGELSARQLLRARARDELGLDLDPGRVDPEGLADVHPASLSRDELAAFLGWALLRGGVPLEERITEVAAARLREAFALLWGSASSDLLMCTTLFAESLPPHRRGRPPLGLLPGPGGEARAHFASEWLFHVLAHKASEAGDDEKKRQPMAQLLRGVFVLEQPINDPKMTPLAKAVGLRSGTGFDSGPLLPMMLWPGPSLLFGLGLLVAVATSSAVAWSLWPARSLTLVQLADYLTFVSALALSTWMAFHLEALDEIFFPAKQGPHLGRVRARLWSLVASTLFFLLVLAFFRVGVTTMIAVSDWAHSKFLASFNLWGGIATGVVQLASGGFVGLLGAGRHLLGLLVFLFKGVLVMYGDSVLLAAALAPAVVLLCAVQRTTLRSFSSWRRDGGPFRILEITVALGLAWIALPIAVTVGQDIFLGFRSFLWWPDFFLGTGAADFLTAALDRLASSQWTGPLGLGMTFVALVFALLGENRERRELWGRLGDDWLLEKSPSLIRPLVAEGSVEALHWSCRLVLSSPSVRGPETVWLLVGLAAGLDEVFLARVTPEEKTKLAGEALKALGRFEPSTSGVREAQKEIERRLAGLGERERERLQQVLAVLESHPQPDEDTAWSHFVLHVVRALGWCGPAPWKEGRGGWIWFKGRGSARDRWRALLPAIATVTAILIVLIGLWHGGVLAFCGALAFLFPLAEPFGPRLFEPLTSLAPLTRVTELASPFLVWVGVAKLMKWRATQIVKTGERHEEN